MADEENQSVKKVSMKSVCGDYKKYVNRLRLPNAPKSVELFAMFGQASGYEQGSGDKGDWTKLLGEFEAVNVDTGERFTGFAAFLPRDITGYFLNAFKGGIPMVEFSVMVGMRLNDTTIGFEYYVKPLVPLAARSVLNKLREETRKALPAVQQKLLAETPATETDKDAAKSKTK